MIAGIFAQVFVGLAYSLSMNACFHLARITDDRTGFKQVRLKTKREFAKATEGIESPDDIEAHSFWHDFSAHPTLDIPAHPTPELEGTLFVRMGSGDLTRRAK